jgi:hypothetical protein
MRDLPWGVLSENPGSLNFLEKVGLSRPVQGWLYLLIFEITL